ncbi:MAG: enoyl-CoA hydratase [Pseudomonadota bacterium]
MSDYRNIYLENDGPLTYLALNRPDKMNALSEETIDEMTAALNSLAATPSVRVIIIRAEGRHFCAGHDLGEMTGREMVAYRAIFSKCTKMMTLLHQVPQPVIAQVHGVATAAGCQLVAACDLAAAEEGSRFGTPGVKIGLFCSTPMVPLFRAVGRKRALEMLLTGRLISAAEAADWGLINLAVPLDQLASRTREMALAIAEASTLTVAVGKKAFHDQADLAEAAAYALAENTMVMNLGAHDAGEGVTAFLEKRKPVWQGK